LNSDLLTRRLLTLRSKRQTNDSLRAIFFGQRSMAVVGAEGPERRVGLWPCVSDDDPLLAMGLWSIMAYGLMARTTTLYKLFYLPHEQEDAEWSPERLTFTVDDLLLDQLNENTALWGRLAHEGEGYRLIVGLEDDFTNQQSEIVVQGPSPQELIANFSELWRSLDELLGLELRENLDFSSEEAQKLENLADLLPALAEWESRLAHLLQYEGTIDTDAWEHLLERLYNWLSLNGDNTTAGWLISQALAPLSYVGYGQLAHYLVDKLNQLARVDFQAWWVIGTVGAMLNLNQRERAFELVEMGLEQRRGSLLYNRLASLYRQDTRLRESLRILQEAIEIEAADVQTYIAYATLLKDFADTSMRAEQLLFVEEDDDDMFVTLCAEAIEALSLALELKPNDLEILFLRTSYELEAEFEDFWQDFEKLLEEDIQGLFIRNLVETIAGQEQLEEAMQTLDSAVKRFPQRLELILAYITALIYEERYDEALDYLDQARHLDKQGNYTYEFERLELAASIDNFEYRLAQIGARVDAKSRITTQEIDFLESVLEQSAHFVPAYLVLARSYQLIGDIDAALEVLTQAEENLPNHAEVIDLMAEYLYTKGEAEAALDKVTQGLKAHPTEVLLLVRAGRLYFDLGNEPMSRQFIRQAEVLDHRHGALQALRVYIANQIQEN